MKKRGRKSAAELTTITPAGVSTIRRSAPPADLSDEQAEEWRAVVNRLQADWFPRETHAVLAQFCRHVVTARRIAQSMTIMEQSTDDSFDMVEYSHLIKLQIGESRILASLATKLRLTQQATIRAEQARKPSQEERPWD